MLEYLYISGGEKVNLLHLKYAVEVDKTRSISKAAEGMYMGQPNLSRAIKELEESLGITIFRRTSKGMEPTPQGERFLVHARSILAQIEEMESLYRMEKENKIKFSLCAPRASYVSDAFARFSLEMDSEKELEIYYKETNSMDAIENVVKGDCSIAVIRYRSDYEKNFKLMLDEKGLKAEEIWNFRPLALMSREHPLANNERITLEDLSKYIEITVADSYVPSVSSVDVQKSAISEISKKRIFVCDRSSQLELLTQNTKTFVRVSPIPQKFIKRHSLVQRRCDDFTYTYQDVIVYKDSYKFTEIDRMFIEFLKKSRDEVAAIPTV